MLQFLDVPGVSASDTSASMILELELWDSSLEYRFLS